MRLGQGNQVSNGLGDYIAISLQVALAPLLGSEYPGNIACNRRLFRQNSDGTGFTRLHRYSQSTAIPREGWVPFQEPWLCICSLKRRHLLPHFYDTSRNALIDMWTFPSLK